MNNKIIFAAVAVIVIAVTLLKNNLNKPESVGNNTVNVVASFYPLYYFTKEIGKEHINSTNLTPAGAEPHDYEPNTQDIVALQKSKLLVVNGAGLEPWADKLKDTLTKNNVTMIAAASELATRQVEEEGETIQDPHVWLDPVLAQQEVEKITQGLMTIDPGNTSVYEENSKRLRDRLESLNQDFQKGLQNCKQKNIVTSHAAFGYLARRYGFRQVAITGLSPDSEPSPKELADVASLAKQDGIKYIFFETLVSPRLAETLANEVGAKTILFNPLEGLTKEEQKKGKDYFSIQKENLENLKIALECI